jgi:site-specific recombinase XerD
VTPIEQWAAEMEFAGKAPTTIRCRTRMLRLLAKEAGDPLTLGKADLVAWLSKRQNASTRSTLLAYLRSFYQWATREGLVDADPTERIGTIKVGDRDPRPAPVADIAAALAEATPRTRSFILLMAYCGLRSCEVAGVRPEHFHEAADGTWTLEIPRGKGGHQQTARVPGWVAQDVLAGPSWELTAQTVQKSVRDAFREAKSPATPHQLRHYFGTSLLHTTDNLRVVQEAMRHKSPATTARYTRVESSQLAAAVEALPRIA